MREKKQKVQGRIGKRPYSVLLLSVVIRAAHQVGAALFLAAYLLDGVESLSRIFTLLAVISGIALIFTEWLRHRELYREVAGLVTMGKCLLLGAAVHGLLPVVSAVLSAFLLASIGAHLPKDIRHRVLL